MIQPRSLSAVLHSMAAFLLLAFALGCASHPNPGEITVDNSSSAVAAGTTAQLHATDIKQRGQRYDVTTTAIWTSTSPSVATISASGLLTGVAAGSTTISAVAGSDSGSLLVTIGAPNVTALSISPLNAQVYVHGTRAYTTSATFSSGTTGVPSGVHWSASPASVATIDGTTGVLTGIAPGSYTVTATVGAATQTATASGTVLDATLTSIAITPLGAALNSGSTLQLTATGTYSDQTTRDLTASVAWVSADPSLLTVSSSGLATAATATTPSTVSVTSTLGSISSSLAVQILPTAVITQLAVEPSSSRIAQGSAERHTATAYYSDGSQKDVSSLVVWTVAGASSPARPAARATSSPVLSSAPLSARPMDDPSDVVSINQSGIDQGLSAGSTQIFATLGTMANQSVVIVTPATITALKIQATYPLFPVGAQQPLHLIGTFSDGTLQDLSLSANWQSGDPAIASVDALGVATGVAPGNITFHASFGGLTASSTGFAVLPPTLLSTVIDVDAPAIVLGVTEQLHLLGNYSDGSTHDLTSLATWVSSNPAVFPVDQQGLAYAITPGSAQTTATVFGRSANTTLTGISDALLAIDVLPVNGKLALGTTLDFTALGHFASGLVINLSNPVLWTSSNPAVLAIDGSGRAQAGSVGTAFVTASLLGVSQVSSVVTVSSATLAHLSLSPSQAQVAAGTSAQFTATAIFSDSSLQDVSPDVLWNTSDPNLASVDKDGTIFGIRPGTVNVTASLAGQTVQAPLTITNATLSSVAVLPANSELPVGVLKQLTLIGTFSDGSIEDLTQDAVWTTPTPQFAAVMQKGRMLGINPGTGVVRAERGLFSGSTVLNVTNATLSSLTFTPADTVLRQGGQQPMTLTGTFSDGYTQNLDLLDGTFTSDHPDVASFGANAIAYGINLGTATLTGSFEGQSASTHSFRVLSSRITSLAITPATPSVTAGQTQQFTATATYADSTTDDVSRSTTWSSSNDAILSIDQNGLATAHATLSPVTVTLTGTTVGNGNAGATTATAPVLVQPAAVLPPPQATLVRIQVTPTSLQLASGTTAPLVATGVYSDGTTSDLSTTVIWSSSSPSVASVSTTGLVTGATPGAAGITAALGTLQSFAAVSVTSATLTSVAISPSGASFAAGATQQFTLTGTFSDGSTQNLSSSATWASSAPGVASISPTGLATGLMPGIVQFTASSGGRTATTPIVSVTAATLVSIAVTPASPSIAKGTTQQFTVMGTYSDGTTHEITGSSTFSSSDPSVLSVSSAGVATGIGAGTAQLTVQSAGQSFNTPAITVTPAVLVSVAVTPSAPSFATGTTQQFTATGTFSDSTTQDLTTQVVWTSSNPAVLTINASGLATGTGTGSTQVSATRGATTGSTGTVSVTPAVFTTLTLVPLTGQIAKGTTLQLTATATFSDGTTQDVSSLVTWSTSNGTVAAVDASGLATGVAVGSATLTAVYRGSSASTVSFNVTPATLVGITFSPASPTVAAGTSTQVTVTGVFSDGTMQDLTFTSNYSSSNPLSVLVGSTGLVTGLLPGSASVTVTASGVSNSFTVTVSTATLVSIAITPANPAPVAKGTTEQFTAIGTYSDATTQDLSTSVLWASSNPLVLTVNLRGLATGSGLGSAQLTATTLGQTATSASVQVTPPVVASILVAPSSATITSGSTQQFTATATNSDGTLTDLSSSVAWTSSNPSLVTIDGSGLATAQSTLIVDSATLTATLTSPSGPLTSMASVTVNPSGNPPPMRTLSSIAITPTSSHAASGTAMQLTAIGTYSDQSTADLTTLVTWSSSAPLNASVNTAGLVSALLPGLATLQAQLGLVQNTAIVNVTAATLSSLAISPSGASFAAGVVQPFTLTGIFSDGSTQDVSAWATWTSSNPGVASVSTTGVATGLTPGTVQFSANYNLQNATTALVTVTPATLISISISPAVANFANGTSQQFTVTGTYSDGTTYDLTSSSTFTSSDPSVVSISGGGLARGAGAGSAQVSATVGGQTITTQAVTVTPATLVELTVTPATASFAKGTTRLFTATGTFSDDTTADLSGQVVWTSTNPSAVSINAVGLASGDASGGTQISAAFDGLTDTTSSVSVTAATLSTLALSPSSGQIAKGTTLQFTATGTFSDATTQDLSSNVTWTTSDGSVVAINGSGLATGTGVGSAQLQAVYQGQTASTTSFTVTPATLVSIAFTPANPTVAAGSSTQVTTLGTFSDGSTQDLSSSALYTSSNPGTAAVNNSGLLTGVSAGPATISVSIGGITSTFDVTVSNAVLVSIAISPVAPPSFAKGTTTQFTATGTYSDSTTQDLSSTISWTSSDPSVFTIDNHGLARGAGVGTASLSATLQGQTANTAPFSVTPAEVASLRVTPAVASIAGLSTQQFTATAVYTDSTTADVSATSTWTSSNIFAAGISNTGLATSLLPGTTTIQAVFGTFSASASLTVSLVAPPPVATLVSIAVTPTNASLVAGASQQYTATGTYSDSSSSNLTGSVTWTSSAPSAASINASGLAFGAAPGSTTLQASSGAVSGSTSLTVTAAPVTLVLITITPSSASVAKGMTQQFTATGNYSDSSTQSLTTQVTWQSSSAPVASIDSGGLSHTLAAGTTQITANYGGRSAMATLTVSPATILSLAVTPQGASVAAGTAQQYKAVGTLSDGSTQDLTTSVAWTSGNTASATIDANGTARGTSVGIATLTATAGSVSASSTLDVTSATVASVQLTPSTINLPAGNFQQLLATATFTDGSSQDVTRSALYSTSNPAVLTVDVNGKLKAVGPGSASVTATLGAATATSLATVSNATLVSIAITPNPLSLAAGTSQQLTATGTFSDGSTDDLTSSVSYSSSNASIASVSATGNVIVARTGSATITASSGGINGTVAVTGTTAVVTAIKVTPVSTTLASGQTQQFAATATLSDSTQQDLTASAHWSVSDGSKATVSDSAGTKGLLSSTAAGTVQVSATSGSATGSASVTIQPAALTSLTITPSTLTLAAGTTQALAVTGHYTDGSTADLTASATFTTSSASAAAVSTQGTVQAVSAGNASITATINGTTAALPVTVTAALLTSIAITPASSTLPVGLHLQLTATGTYSDGSTADVSALAQWSSTAPAVATVSGTGLITGITVGSSTLRASLNGITQQVPVNVTAATLQSIAVLPAGASFPLGLSQQLQAIGTYSDGTTQDLTASATWSSQTPSIGVVSASGLATGVTTGSFNARATRSGITGSTPVTISAAILQSIVVTPANQIFLYVGGGPIQFTATGHYSDGSTVDITNSVHWATPSGLGIGTISQTGSFSTLGLGLATISATSGAISGQTGALIVLIL